jgi:hypothetical protein
MIVLRGKADKIKTSLKNWWPETAPFSLVLCLGIACNVMLYFAGIADSTIT